MSRPTDLLTFSLVSPASPSPSSSRSPLPPPGTSLVLTDTLASPAQFALAHYIQRALRPALGAPSGHGKGKAREARRMVLVGVREREEFWAAVLKKNGIQLPAESAAGRFTFVDASSPSVPLSSLYASLCDVVRPSSLSGDSDDETGGALVLIDDLNALMWRGEPAREVARWWKAVRAAVDATHSSLITLLHADSLSPSFPVQPSSTGYSSSPFEDPEDQYLFRQVLQRSEVWVEVTGLTSGGGAGGIRGEITIHRGPALIEGEASGFTLDPAPPLQYKLEDHGAVYEVKGLGRFL
ncbi:hypothetical protein JCM10207_001889 [Rhodosporidiobolus poonsookiae]